MRLRAMFLAVLTVAALALAVAAAGFAAGPSYPAHRFDPAIGHAIRLPPGAIRVQCNRPDALRLIRFEDGSARLECGRRTLVRVSVPG